MTNCDVVGRCPPCGGPVWSDRLGSGVGVGVGVAGVVAPGPCGPDRAEMLGPVECAEPASVACLAPAPAPATIATSPTTRHSPAAAAATVMISRSVRCRPGRPGLLGSGPPCRERDGDCHSPPKPSVIAAAVRAGWATLSGTLAPGDQQRSQRLSYRVCLRAGVDVCLPAPGRRCPQRPGV